MDRAEASPAGVLWPAPSFGVTSQGVVFAVFPGCTVHVPPWLAVTVPDTVTLLLTLTSRFCPLSHCSSPTWLLASVAGVVRNRQPVCTGFLVGAAPTASGPLTMGSAKV